MSDQVYELKHPKMRQKREVSYRLIQRYVLGKLMQHLSHAFLVEESRGARSRPLRACRHRRGRAADRTKALYHALLRLLVLLYPANVHISRHFVGLGPSTGQ